MNQKRIDWFTTLIPFIVIIVLSIIFLIFPTASNQFLSQIRFFFGDTMGVYYLILGIGVFIVTIWIASSKYGNIVLGKSSEKPKYSSVTWGTMMFTAGLAADILYYSFSEWILYAVDPYLSKLGNSQEWVGVFPVFHWSLIPWSFYLLLSVAFGFMLHIRKRERQKFSEACRPILGRYTDGLLGKIIDLLAVFALLAGTATTFTLATPLMSTIINLLLNTSIDIRLITLVILIITCIIYTYVLLYGFKGISLLAKMCTVFFGVLLAYVLLFGGQFQFIIENSFSSVGKMIQHFLELATYTDPRRTTSFPQKWTIFYWSYWIVWCVATPFFIGNISKGRTIRQTIFGGYLFGAGSTVLSFLILGNYSLGKQVSGATNFIQSYQQKGNLYQVIIEIVNSLPLASIVLLFLLITMIIFYATSFDSIAYIASCYSYYHLKERERPHKIIQLIWCVLLIVLPIALIFSDSSINNLQSISIISAFPIGIIFIIIILSFIKDMKQFYGEEMIIQNNRETHKLIAEALLKYETLDSTQIKSLYETGEMPEPSDDDKAAALSYDEVKSKLD